MNPYILPGTFRGMIDPELELFYRLLPKLEEKSDAPLLGVEIGCMDGWSTAHILDATKRMNLVSIDPFLPDSMEPALRGNRDRLWINTMPWPDRFRLLQGYSQEIAKGWSRPIDFVFIDGDHHYEAVLLDFKVWSGFLRPGGLLAMHDSRMSREGGARYHIGPSYVAKKHVYGKPQDWEIVGEAWSLTVAKKISPGHNRTNAVL